MASNDQRLRDELHRLRGEGVTLPRHTGRAMRDYGEMVHTQHGLLAAAGHDLDKLSASTGRKISASNYDDPEVQTMIKENDAKIKVMDQKRLLGKRMDRLSRMER